MILMAEWKVLVLVLFLLFHECVFQYTQRNTTSSDAVQFTSVQENIWLSLRITASSSHSQPTASSVHYGSTYKNNSTDSSEERVQLLIIYISVSVAVSSIALILIIAICLCRSEKRKKTTFSSSFRNNSEQKLSSDNIQQSIELIPRPESESDHTPTSESCEIPPPFPRKRIQRKQLRIGIKLGEENAPPSDLQDLLNELKIMMGLKPHPNVVELIGAILDDKEHPLVVVEFVPFGDLLGYLRKSRGIQDTCYTQTDHFPITSLTSKDLLKFAIDSANGMTYLSKKKIVHRDLAARNVLVGKERTCKITDFGMARDLRKNEIYTKTTRGLIPVKWTAIESIIHGIYTTRSDVWSFGVLMFEILTVGGCPYPRMSGLEVRQLISGGYRMPKPTHVDNELYAVMCECWDSNPRKRPTFEDLVCILKRLQPHHKEYVNLSQYDPCHYENIDNILHP